MPTAPDVSPTLFQSTGPELNFSTPERRLAFAVLVDAIRRLQQGAIGATDAEAWLASNATDHPFAFLAICQAVGLDADFVRRGIRRLRGGMSRARAA